MTPPKKQSAKNYRTSENLQMSANHCCTCEKSGPDSRLIKSKKWSNVNEHEEHQNKRKRNLYFNTDSLKCGTTCNSINENKSEIVKKDSNVELSCRCHGNTSELSSTDLKKVNSYTVLQRVLFNNFFFSVGDIVSLEDDSNTYYAQIRILIEDLFCQKYAALIWLLPTEVTNSSSHTFNPCVYTYGPQDDWFYNIEELQFIMHAPTDAYKQFIAPTPKCTNITHIRIKCKPKRKIQ